MKDFFFKTIQNKFVVISIILLKNSSMISEGAERGGMQELYVSVAFLMLAVAWAPPLLIQQLAWGIINYFKASLNILRGLLNSGYTQESVPLVTCVEEAENRG